jgi:mono/diheme cytochrome c family protein
MNFLEAVSMRVLLLAAGFLLAPPALAQSATGDAESGRVLALKHCSSCHVVAPRQAPPSTDAVPTFAAIARDPAATEVSLRVFLRSPHARMPDLILSRTEIDDVVTYILSLRTPR